MINCKYCKEILTPNPNFHKIIPFYEEKKIVVQYETYYCGECKKIFYTKMEEMTMEKL